MAIEQINLGTVVQDGADGDVARVAFTKVNANFADLESRKVEKVAGKQLSTEDYTSAEKMKLGGIESGAQVNVATDLSQGTRTPTSVQINSSTGTAATLSTATTALAGLQSAADKVKLDATAAQVGDIATALDLINGEVI